MHPSTTDDTAADNVQNQSEGWRISNLEASEEASIAEAPEAGGFSMHVLRMKDVRPSFVVQESLKGRTF